jgi:hypothetical protein
MSFDKRCLLGPSRKQGILSWKMEGKADKFDNCLAFWFSFILWPIHNTSFRSKTRLNELTTVKIPEFKRSWLFERRLSSNQQLKTLPNSHLFPVVLFCLIPLSQDTSIPALFLLCGPTILPLEFSDYPSSFISLIPPNPSSFAIPLSQHFDFSVVQLPRPRDIQYYPTLWVLWPCYLSTSRSQNPLSALLTNLTIPAVSFYCSDPSITTI